MMKRKVMVSYGMISKCRCGLLTLDLCRIYERFVARTPNDPFAMRSRHDSIYARRSFPDSKSSWWREAMHVVMVHLNYMTEIQNARRGRRQDVQFSGIFCLLLDSRESVVLRAISRNTRHFHVSTSADLCIEGRRR